MARRLQVARVIAIAPHVAANSDGAIERAREPNREPAKPARERAPVARFDDEVRVVVLNRKLDERS